MKLQEIYRIALADGITAKQAGKRFGVNWKSIVKVRHRYQFPLLKTDSEHEIECQIARMNDTQLGSYLTMLNLPKNSDCKLERELVVAEFFKRHESKKDI